MKQVTLIKPTALVQCCGEIKVIVLYNLHLYSCICQGMRYTDWNDKFGPLGLTCCKLTGDTEMDDYFELRAHIITTTPVSLSIRWSCLIPCTTLIIILLQCVGKMGQYD